MTGGIFVDGGSVAGALRELGSRVTEPRIDFRKFAKVIEREASRLAGKEISFPIRSFYRGVKDGEMTDRARRFSNHLETCGWNVTLRASKRYEDGHHEDKGVDLEIALDAYRLVVLGHIDALAIVTHDSDFAALFERLPPEMPRFAIGWDGKMARELKQESKPIFMDRIWQDIAETGR